MSRVLGVASRDREEPEPREAVSRADALSWAPVALRDTGFFFGGAGSGQVHWKERKKMLVQSKGKGGTTSPELRSRTDLPVRMFATMAIRFPLITLEWVG